MRQRASLHGARVPQGEGGGSLLQDPRLEVLGSGRAYYKKRGFSIEGARRLGQEAGFLGKDQVIYLYHPDIGLIIRRADGLPIGSEVLLDQALEADRQHSQNAMLRMQCWNEALHRCKHSPWLTNAVYEQLLQQMGLRTPSGRGYSDSHRQKSEHAQDRRKAKLPQPGELSTTPQPTATDRKSDRKRKPLRSPAIAPLPPA
jgi:hypothetical protein